MSKAVDAVTKIFTGITGVGKPDVARQASQIGGQPTAEQLAEQRAALGAQGRRVKQEELNRFGERPLQGGSGKAGMWI